MGKSANEYLESLFKGIDTLIEKRFETLAYDTTIVCTIVDNSNKKNGEYKVSNGSVIYTAYSDVNNYSQGDQVRVSIPMGDYTQKKFIVGKYATNNDSSPITYISPVDTIVNISGNLVTGNTKYGIAANGNEKEKIIWNKKLDSSFISMQNNNIYNTIVLKAEFKTLFDNYDLISGNYGVRLDFLVRPSSKSSVHIKRYVELDSSEMFGNPYGFSVYSPQTKVIKLNTIGIVEGLELTLYQKGNFKDRTLGKLEPINKKNPTQDILIKDVVIGLGCDLEKTEDNTLQIYTENDLSYCYGQHNSTTNLKKMGLLWLNKDEDNKYIGFSDGIYSSKYDELAYLEKAKKKTRLLNQKGRDGVPTTAKGLELAANIEEAYPLIKSAIEVVDIDLSTLLQDFALKVEDVSTYVTNISNVIATISTKAANLWNYLDNPETGKIGLAQQYEFVLNYTYEIQNSINHTKNWNGDWVKKSYGVLIAKTFNEIINLINTLLETTSGGGFEKINKEYSGLKSIYDSYSVRIKRLLEIMKGYLGQSSNTEYNKTFPDGVIPELKSSPSNPADFNTLTTLGRKGSSDVEKSDLIAYKEPDLSDYDNKYCIYWFRYEPNYITPDSEQILSDGWRRLKPEDFPEKNKKSFANDKDAINIGLSSYWKDSSGQPIKNKEGKKLHAPKPELGMGFINRYMQNDFEQERYMAVLFYNHNMYKSNELVFTNKDVIPDKTTLDKGDILTFEHLANSTNTYQVYDVSYYLMNRSDEHRNRQIRCHYDGLLAKDNAFVNGQIYWYVPAVSTMLTVDIDDLINNKKFVLDDKRSKIGYQRVTFNQYKPYEVNKYYIFNNTTGKYNLCEDSESDENDYKVPDVSKRYYERVYTEYCFYKKVLARDISASVDQDAKAWDKWDYTNNTEIDNRDFWYKIKPNYNDSARNNTITCVFIKNEEEDEVSGGESFSFGIKGTSGTKYTLTVNNRTTQNAATTSKGLSLYCEIKDCDNEVLNFNDTISDFTIEWNGAYRSGNKSLLPASENINISSDKKEYAFSTPSDHFGILSLTGKITLKNSIPNDKTQNAQKDRTVDLNVLYSVPYSTGNYFIDGPTQIIYNGLGTIDNNSIYSNPYQLFAKNVVNVEVPWTYTDKDEFDKDRDDKYIWDSENSEYIKATGAYNSRTAYYKKVKYKAGELIPSATWSIDYYKVSNKKITNLDSNEENFCKAYMPTIQENHLVPSPLYMSGLNCVAVITARVGKKAKWRQMLLILQNRYGSAMLNDWDGSFKIDDENGTIMGTMFGAGKKTSNNTFEGILMGDVATTAGVGFDNNDTFGTDIQKGMGIYGFHDGAQSFGLNSDGTAFFGKSGAGRIIFNGKCGVIASANWFTGANETYNDVIIEGRPGLINPSGGIAQYSNAGTCIDLQSGMINAYNFKVVSKNIYLNSEPANNTDYYIKIGHTSDDPDTYPGALRTVSKTDGCISLNKAGYLFIQSKNFLLDAFGDDDNNANNDKGIYLNSNPTSGQSYLKVGNSNNLINLYLDGTQEKLKISAWDSTNDKGISIKSHPANNESYFRVTGGNGEIRFYKNSSGTDSFYLSSKNFLLNAFSNSKGIYLNSSPTSGQSYLKVGNSNNLINLYLDGTQEKLEISAWNSSKGVSIRSHPTKGQSYFKVAGGNGEIDFYKDSSGNDSFYLSSKNFNLSAGTSPKIITITSDSSYNPLTIGSKFYVEWDGTVHASSAKISGEISADKLTIASTCTIGGWYVNDTSLYNDGVYLDGSTGTISGSSISGSSIEGQSTLDLGNASYYLKMGMGTNHPEVSGLNITGSETGIAMGSNGISGCTDIGGNNGTILFTTNGVETKANFYLSGGTNLYLGDEDLYDFVNGYFTNGETVKLTIEADGGTGTYTCKFVNGLLTEVSKNGSAAEPDYSVEE